MKVLIAIDQTPYWQQILDAVSKRHWPGGTLFKILSVVEPADRPDSDPVEWQLLALEAYNRRHRETEQILATARALLVESLSDCSIHTEIETGDPRIIILNVAAQWMPDKIVLGAHGHIPNRLVPGTCTRTIARHSPCTIELIRLRPHKHEHPVKKTILETACS